MEKQWREVLPQTNEGEVWDFDENAILIGAFESKQENIGKNKNSTLYTFKVDDDFVKVWGGIVLDNRLSEMEKGQEVKIEYVGKVVGKSGNAYKDYKVYLAE
jgi:hypothetical protein